MVSLLYILLQTPGAGSSDWVDLASKLTVTGSLIIAVVYFQRLNVAISTKAENDLKAKQLELDKVRADSKDEIEEIRNQYEAKMEKVLDRHVSFTEKAMQNINDNTVSNRELTKINQQMVQAITELPKQLKS